MPTVDLSHLDAIDLRLSRARQRLADATATPVAKQRMGRGHKVVWCAHEVVMIERERAAELAFLVKLGYVEPVSVDSISDADLLALLA